MKFFSVTFVVALFCAVAVSAAPSSSPFYSEFSLIDESTFGITDSVTKVLNSLIEKTKCTLDVIEDVIGDGELGNVYKKFRSDIETIIKVNVTECVHTKGLTPKLKCTLAITKKINTLYFTFLKQVLKTNKDLATKITKALVQCSKKQATFISNEDVFVSDTASNVYDELIKKIKCALDAIEHIVGEGELANFYKKLRSDVEAILEHDVKECAHTNGLIAKAKCFLTLTQKINTLYAKFVSEVMKANKDVAKKITKAVVECLKTPKPEEPKPEEPKTPIDEAFISTFDSADTVVKVLNALIEKTKCSLDVLQDLLKGTELEGVYKKLQTEVESILEKDVKQCEQTEGVVGKINCLLSVTQKVNTLFADFVKEALKTNKDLDTKIYNSIVKCAKKSY